MVKILKKLKKIELVVFVIVLFLFSLLIKHYIFSESNIRNLNNFISDSKKSINGIIRHNFIQCQEDEKKIKVSGGYVCQVEVKSSVWSEIYDTYPISANGKEIIYSFLDEGNIEVANKYLNGVYQIDRYEDFKIDNEITWEENPYDERYWRFMFYSLRQTRHLLYAGKKTENLAYFNKLKEILESFCDTGINKEQTWDDSHAVSFRTMVLINSWWKLRDQNLLSYELSEKILKALKMHGEYLYDEKNYQITYNHSISQAAALFLLTVNFPELDDDNQWLNASKERLSIGLLEIVDDDGILVENSPYYHFYALEKYWEIRKYTKDNNIIIDEEFADKINKMISYAVNILQPDLNIPLLGASLERKISFAKKYKEIVQENNNLLYVLTKGKQGQEPQNKSIYYPAAGQTIMRSAWGKGDSFENQTQIIFDVGPYRTDHSDLDALNFVLYSQGEVLVEDPGLYTYEINNFRNYFHGTNAHNTIVVDGKDQDRGSAIATKFFESGGYVYQTATENLNKGVKHSRAMILLGNNLVLILDNLNSNNQHAYEQKFHLNPNAEISTDGLNVKVKGNKTEFIIHQLLPDGMSVNTVKGQEQPLDGWCSFKYEEKTPCYSVSYKQNSNNAFFATLITIGDADKNFVAQIDRDNKNIEIKTNKNTYNINIRTILGEKEKISIADNKDNAVKKKEVLFFNNSENWIFNAKQVQQTENYFNDDGLFINNSSTVEATINKNIDLSRNNLILRMKIKNIANVDNISLLLSNNNWSRFASYSLSNVYRTEYDGEWIDISIGKGEFRDSGGQWRFNQDGFDWSKIDNIKFKFSVFKDKKASLSLNKLYIVPEQNNGCVVIIFDDGHKTISQAADLMKKYSIKGNVSVIGERPDNKIRNYLSLDDLKKLQNNDDWNIVNHSYYHKNALTDYFEKNNLSGYEDDILKALKYLEKNGINSAPNWFIYPNGATNEEIKKIISKYYKFARTTQNSPEIYPFGDPLGVKSFSVNDDALPEEVSLAIQDTKKYNLTLFLTFHRIKTSVDDSAGYYIGDFDKILKSILEQGISVKTLSELDISNNETLNKIQIKDYIPSKIVLDVKVVKNREKQNATLKIVLFLIILSIGGIIVYVYKLRHKQNV